MIASPNELIYFLEVSQTLNFSRASERIGISQPSLSVAIKKLEHALGTPLFIRHKNGVVLTHAGKRFLSHSKQLLQQWETAKSETLASHHQVQGSITVGCHPSIALLTMPKVLPSILVNHPKLEIQLKHDFSRNILEAIINFSIDIGLVVNPVKHPDLILQKLYDDKVTFWCAKNHAGTLNENGILFCDPNLLQTQILLKKLNKSHPKYFRITSTSNLGLIAKLTATGTGVGILPTSIALSAGDAKIKPIPKMPFYNDEIYLAYRHENRDVQAIKTTVQAIKDYFKNSVL